MQKEKDNTCFHIGGVEADKIYVIIHLATSSNKSCYKEESLCTWGLFDRDNF